MVAQISENSRVGNTKPPGKSLTPKRKISEIAQISVVSGSDDQTENETTTSIKKQIAFNWILTWHNYPENWQDFFTERKSLIEKVCIGEEVCPTTGTKHLQGWLKLFHKNNAITYLTLPIQISWRVMSRNATERSNVKYCSKDQCNLLHWGIELPWKREIKDLQPWMTELEAILSQPLEEGDAFRTIHWIWDTDGNVGKTVFQQAMYYKLKNVVLIEGKSADIKHFVCDYVKKNGTTPKIVFINLPRSEQEFISYGAIERVKDMFFMSGKYEGGMVSGPRPHVMAFANEPPHCEKMSQDRWRIGHLRNGILEWNR